MLSSLLTVAVILAAPPAKAERVQRELAPAPAPMPSAWTAPAADGFRFSDGLHGALRAHEVRQARVSVPLAGHGEVTLVLRRFEPVTTDARVELGSGTRTVAPALSATLRNIVHFEGSVEGHDRGSCYIAFGESGAAGWVHLGTGEGEFTLRRVASEAPGLCAGTLEFVRSVGTSAPAVPACGGVHGADAGDGSLAGFGAVPPGVRKVVEIAFDSDYDYYAIFGNQVAATEYIGVLTGAISAIYRRDCDSTIKVAYLRLQTDAADLFNESDPLVPFRNYWNANGDAVSRDLFTLITGRRNLPYGGVAYLNSACQNFGYSVNGYIVGRFVDPVATHPGNWDINVVAHEWGHNLGTRHTHDYAIDSCASGTVQRGTIMSYCHVVSGASSNIDLRFHRGTAEAIESFVSGALCLSSDCNDNGIDDAAEIDAVPALDSNLDGILDACQDCNANGQPDPVEILLGLVGDSDGDLLPDPCEDDCDGDGVADSLEISLTPALDFDGDMVLDSCQPDCDSNGKADAVEIIQDMALDRSRDGRLDACEDCDGDGVVDFTELAGSKSRWVASSSDTLLRELDPRSGIVRRTVPVPAAVNDLAIGPDGRLMIAAGTRVYAFDRVTGVAPVEFSPVLPAEARAVAIAPNGGLAVLLANGRIDILDAAGQVNSTFVQQFAAGDAQDLVFRVGAGVDPVAFVTRSNGVIRRFSWPTAASGTFADLSALAPGLRGAFVLADGSVLVAASALNQIIRLDPNGVNLGEWDVESGALLTGVVAICDAGDGRAVLATAPGSASTINGYNKATGYTERTYRVYPADAPSPTAIVVAPASATDADGDLVPDECESVLGDLDGDGVVNGSDLAILLTSFGSCTGCAADLDGDGQVTAADLAILINAWT